MNKVKKTYTLVLPLLGLILMTGCSPKIGSDAWCDVMKEKSKADWSTNDAADFAQHCVFK